MINASAGTVPYGIYVEVSAASGQEAQLIASALESAQDSEFESATLSGARLSALCELESFYVEARQNNWDGEGALPVSERAFQNACAFIGLMPRNWTKPEISADPDGEIAVEWQAGPRRRFSISIGSDARVSYAWLRGSERGNATDMFIDEIPHGVATQIDRLASA